MKKLILIIGLLSVVVLSGCKTEQQAFQKATEGCIMTGYEVVQGVNRPFTSIHFYECVEIGITPNRANKFNQCSYDCDRAIDDYRDVSNIEDLTIGCLKLCMGE